MQGDWAANRLITLTWPVGESALTWYVRPGGDDNNSGTSAIDAFATLPRALREAALYAANRPTIIDITGMTIAEAELLQLGGGTLGSTINTADATPAPPAIPMRRQTQIVAEPTAVQTFNVTSNATHPTSGLVTLTVSDAINPGDLDDLIIGGSGPGELAAIKNYTTGAGPNTIQIDATSAPSAPVIAYAPGASMRYGDPAQAQDGAIHLTALSDWAFQWISFFSTDDDKASAITMWPHQPVTMVGCVMDGIQMIGGAGDVLLYACVVRNRSYVQDGANVRLERTALRNLAALDCNGSGAQAGTTLFQSSVDACPAWGAGSSTSRFSAEVRNTEILNATVYGVQCLFGVWLFDQVLIDAAGASGIFVQNASITLSGVAGTNIDYGVVAARHCSVESVGATITGGVDDLSIGTSGDFEWSEMPVTDIERLARVNQSGI